jgi:threonyl-tRNA synthetase
VDNPELWKFSEKIVLEVIQELGVDYILGPGEAAFYGPKIDFQATTVTGREESISTTQLDFSSPLRFNLTYIGEDGKEHKPYIIHRAPLGTHERFLAFLIEHFGGAFPTWMSPTQVRIIPVKDTVFDYADKLEAELLTKLGRVEVDKSDNSFNKKIREAVTTKIPNIVIIGEKEKETGSITLRRYAVSEQKNMSYTDFINYFEDLYQNRVMDNFAD